MQGRTGWIWRVAAVVVLAVQLAAAHPALRAAAQGYASNGISLVQSDQFGYYFWYDSTVWSVANESAEPGSEQIRLIDGEVFVDYWAFLAPDMSPRDCLGLVLDAIVADPDIVAVEALAIEGGPPMIAEAGRGWVSTDLIVTIDGDAGRSKLVTREACGSIAPDGVLLYKSVNVPAAIFNGWGGYFFDADPEIASSFPVVDGFDLQSPPVAIPGRTGSPTGAMSTSVSCGSSSFLVVGQNAASGGNFVIDPDRFVAVYAADDLRPGFAGNAAGPVRVEWLSPSLSAAHSLVLGSGEVGLFKATVPEVGLDLFYVSESGDPVFVASNPTGCGGGGAAPIIVDME